MAEVFWVGQRSDQFVVWHILDNYHFCIINRHAFHCVFVLASALPSTCKKGSCMSHAVTGQIRGPMRARNRQMSSQ